MLLLMIRNFKIDSTFILYEKGLPVAEYQSKL